MRRIYVVWGLGLLLKLVGASWDVAWHFRLLREAISPPHIVNLIGDLICAAAFLYEWRNLEQHRRTPLLITGAGMALFAFAIPFDQLWHTLYGIDLTTWSPAHLMLFYGTTVGVAGITLLYLADLRHEHGSFLRATRVEKILLALLLIGLAESFAFPLGYNEYTVTVVQSIATNPGAIDPALVERAPWAVSQGLNPVFLGTPEWLYPVYAIAFVAFLATMVRASLGPGWAFVMLAGLSVERVLANGLIVAAGWPNAVIPLQYIGMGLIIEAAWMVPVRDSTRALVGGAAVALGGYVYFVSPPVWLPSIPLDASSWPVGVGVAIALAYGGYKLQQLAPAFITRVDEVEWDRVSGWARAQWDEWRG
jgi:hypothetical protein